VKVELGQGLADLGRVPMEVRQQLTDKLLVCTANPWSPNLHGSDTRGQPTFLSMAISIADRISSLTSLALPPSQELSNLLL
jgi:hypothetical protein